MAGGPTAAPQRARQAGARLQSALAATCVLLADPVSRQGGGLSWSESAKASVTVGWHADPLMLPQLHVGAIAGESRAGPEPAGLWRGCVWGSTFSLWCAARPVCCYCEQRSRSQDAVTSCRPHWEEPRNVGGIVCDPACQGRGPEIVSWPLRSSGCVTPLLGPVLSSSVCEHTGACSCSSSGPSPELQNRVSAKGLGDRCPQSLGVLGKFGEPCFRGRWLGSRREERA